MNDSSTSGFMPMDSRKSNTRSMLKNENRYWLSWFTSVPMSSLSRPWKRTCLKPSSRWARVSCCCQSARNAVGAWQLPTQWRHGWRSGCDGADRSHVKATGGVVADGAGEDGDMETFGASSAEAMSDGRQV